MTPTQDYQDGRLSEALAGWGAQLATGRSWTEVQAEIIGCCQGRVDLLTGLLIEAETACENIRGAAPHRVPATCPQRAAALRARLPHWSSPERVPANALGIGRWY